VQRAPNNEYCIVGAQVGHGVPLRILFCPRDRSTMLSTRLQRTAALGAIQRPVVDRQLSTQCTCRSTMSIRKSVSDFMLAKCLLTFAVCQFHVNRNAGTGPRELPLASETTDAFQTQLTRLEDSPHGYSYNHSQKPAQPSHDADLVPPLLARVAPGRLHQSPLGRLPL
jgi:hypothetical protein